MTGLLPRASRRTVPRHYPDQRLRVAHSMLALWMSHMTPDCWRRPFTAAPNKLNILWKQLVVAVHLLTTTTMGGWAFSFCLARGLMGQIGRASCRGRV